MKHIATLFMLCLLASAAWASEIEFIAGIDNGDSPGTAQAYTIIKDGIKIHVSNGVANETQYRVYKNQNATITSTIGKIAMVVFECVAENGSQYGPGNFTVNTGDYNYGGKIGTWEGSSDSIMFIASGSQVRITRIVVTIDDGNGVSMPRISPAGGTYYEPITVTMTCTNNDAAIYYTTDGSEPTIGSTLYTEPLVLYADTTVRAIAALDGELSNVATASYVFPLVTPVQNLWESQLLQDETVVRFVNQVQVVAQFSNYLFVKDNSGYGLLYGNTKQTYKTGDIIPAGFVGTMATYACEREMKDLMNFSPKAGNEDIQPEIITPNQIGHRTFAHYVMLRGVTFISSGGNYWVTDASGQMAKVNFSMGVSPSGGLDATYDAVGVIASRQIAPGECEYVFVPISLTPIIDFSTVSFTAIYQNGYYLFVKVHEGDGVVDPGVIIPTANDADDGVYGVVYGHLTNHFVNGDVIQNAQCTVSEYNGTKQYIPVDETFVVAYHGDPVEPKEMPFEEISSDMIYWYVIFRGVDYTVFDSGIQPLISDETGDLMVYNRFGVPITIYNPQQENPFDPNEDGEETIADVNAVIDFIFGGGLVEDPLYGKYDVTGFLSIYKGLIQLYPIKIVYHAYRYLLRGDVNGDGEVNVADVNALLDHLLNKHR